MRGDALDMAILIGTLTTGVALIVLVVAGAGERAKVIDACIARGGVPVEVNGNITCPKADGRLMGRSVDTRGKMP